MHVRQLRSMQQEHSEQRAGAPGAGCSRPGSPCCAAVSSPSLKGKKKKKKDTQARRVRTRVRAESMRCTRGFRKRNVYIAPQAGTQLQLRMQSWKVEVGLATAGGTRVCKYGAANGRSEDTHQTLTQNSFPVLCI